MNDKMRLRDDKEVNGRKKQLAIMFQMFMERLDMVATDVQKEMKAIKEDVKKEINQNNMELKNLKARVVEIKEDVKKEMKAIKEDVKKEINQNNMELKKLKAIVATKDDIKELREVFTNSVKKDYDVENKNDVFKNKNEIQNIELDKEKKELENEKYDKMDLTNNENVDFENEVKQIQGYDKKYKNEYYMDEENKFKNNIDDKYEVLKKIINWKNNQSKIWEERKYCIINRKIWYYTSQSLMTKYEFYDNMMKIKIKKNYYQRCRENNNGEDIKFEENKFSVKGRLNYYERGKIIIKMNCVNDCENED